MVEKEYSAQKLIDTIVEGMQNIKAENIVILDLKETGNSICDYFIICNAESNTQVNSIADSVEKKVREKLKEKSIHKEGFENASWVLLDYSDIVVHIFQTEARAFYNIEDFWDDAVKTEIPNLQ